MLSDPFDAMEGNGLPTDFALPMPEARPVVTHADDNILLRANLGRRGPDRVRIQDPPTRLGIRNIRVYRDDSPPYALVDVYVDHWVGQIEGTETWGPGPVYVGGDVTIENGATLTISVNTEVRFLTPGGADDNGYPELIVASGGQLTVETGVTFGLDEQAANRAASYGLRIEPMGTATLNGATLPEGTHQWSQTAPVELRMANFAASSYSAIEGGLLLDAPSPSPRAGRAVTVRLTPAPTEIVEIQIAVRAGTAEEADYGVSGLNTAGGLVFQPNQVSQSFKIVAKPDADVEDETIGLSFGTLPAGVLAGDPATSTVTVTIYDTPNKPTGLTATPGHRQVTLTWDDPENDGIDGWQYRKRRGDQSWEDWKSIEGSGASTTECTVPELTDGVKYLFRVRAYTRGYGVTSASVSATPSGLQAEAYRGAVVLRWVDPERDDIASWQYQVKEVPGDWSEWSAAGRGASSRSHTVRDLTNEVRHRFKVRGMTAEGETALTWSTVEATPKATLPLPPNAAGTVTLSSTSAQEGTALTATLTDPDGSVSATTWQWQASSTSPAVWEDLTSSDASTSSYRPRASDVGSQLRATVGYTDAHGPGNTAQSAGIGPVTPCVTVSSSRASDAISLVEGTLTVASFTATSGCGSTSWSLAGPDSLAFAISPHGHLAFASAPDFENPADANTDNDYEVTVVATAAGEGTPSASRSVTVTVTDKPEPRPGTVTLSSTSPQEGTALTATLTDPDGEISAITWQWQASNSSPAVWHNRGTGSRYTPTDSDVGFVLRATVSYTDALGSDSAQSKPTDEVTICPTLSGSESVEYAENGTDAVDTYTATSYCGSLTWILEGSDAGDFQLTGSGSSRNLQFRSVPNFESPADADTDNDYKVTVRVFTESPGPGSPSATRSVTVTVTNVDEAGSVSLSSTSPQEGTAVTATLTDPDGEISDTTWQWQASTTSPASWEDLTSSDASTSRYTPTDSDVGYVLRATVSYTDALGSDSAESELTDEVTICPTLSGLESVDYAENGTGAVASYTATSDCGSLTWILEGSDAGDFQLIGSGSSRSLQFQSAPNFESPADANTDNDYSVTVRVFTESPGPGSPSATRSVTVTVTNVDEAGSVSLSSTSPQVGTAVTATLTDPDGEISDTTWQWQASTTSPASWEDLTTSDASTSRYTPTDSDVGYVLRATVSYTDALGSDSAESELTDEVTICPTLSGLESVDYAENGTGAVASYTATSDCGSLTWILEGSDAGDFQLIGSGSSRSLQFQSAPNFESPADANTDNDYSVTVRVFTESPGPGSPSATRSVTVTVTNVDEAGSVSLSSTSPQVGTALTATLSDPDGSVSDTTWQWQASNSSPASWEDLTSSDASTSRYTPTDSDVGYVLRATVSYTDALGSDSAESELTDEVTICPTLSGLESVDYAENGTGAVASYTATSDCGSLTWILEGSDAGDFQLTGTGSSRSLQFQSAPDFEAPTDRAEPGIPIESRNNDYKVTVKVTATAAGPGLLSSTRSLPVTVTVTNVNEPGEVSLSSTTPQVDRALTATLSDPDGEISDTTWQWQASNSSPASWEDLTTSDASTSRYTPTDSDVGYVLRATVSYTDALGSDSAESELTDEVTICPTLSGLESVDYAENGTGAVASYTATSDCGSLTWILEGSDAGDFQLTGTGSSRSLQFQSAPNFESPADANTDNDYSVTVKATAASPGLPSATRSVTVTVTNVDEAGSVSLSSTSPQVDTAVTASLTDPDGGVSATTWQWQASNTSPAVWHNRGTGSSYTPTASDVGYQLRATVSYTDGHGSGKSAQSGATGAVTPPPCALSMSGATSVNYAENGSGSVGTYTATASYCGSLTWSLSGTDAGDFQLTGTGSSRSLQFQSTPNFESPADADTDNDYSVTVKATAASPGLPSATRSVTVTVTNVDEAGSVSLSSTSPQVDTAVTASLSDPDGSVSATTWQWQASNTSPAVWHNRGTGSSYTPTSSDEGYVLRATASYTDGHGSGKSAQSGATGAVTTPPCALSMSGATSVNYAENGSGSVGTYTATASYCGSLTWSLSGTDAGDFQLTGTGSSRSLQFQSAPNFESPADADTDNDYSVTVKATAASPGLPSATRSVTVTVTNVDEAGSVSLSSTSPQVDTAVTASLSDPDGSVSATTWQWQASNTSPAVWHNRGTGSSYTPTSSDEGYVLRATASYTDGHGSGKSAQSGATGAVTTPPCALSMSGATSVSYAENGSGSVGTYTATASYCGSLTWSLEGTDAGDFQLTGTGSSRSLQFQSTPNFESPADADTDNDYSVTVKATAASPGLPSATRSVTVTVTNVDEAGSVSLSSTSPQVDTAVTASLSDPDGSVSATTWQWQASNTSPAVWHNRGTGSSYTPTSSDEGYVLRATASYTDGHGSGKSAQSGATGAVTTPPCALSMSGATSVNYAENGSGSVGTYTATASYCGSLTWSLEGTDAGDFQLTGTGSSRSLQFQSAPNFESPADANTDNDYSVTVKATAASPGLPSATRSVTVTVTNVDEAGSVSLSSTSPQVDTAVTASLSDPDGSVSATTWQWQASNTSPAVWHNRGTGSSYTPTSSDEGYVLRATASYTDGHGSGKSAQSGATGAVTTPPCALSMSGATSVSYAENGTGSVGTYTATASYCGTLTWILEGSDAGDFQLTGSGSSRSLQFQSAPNFESPADADTDNDYKVTVRVFTESPGPGSPSATRSVTVTVTNVDEAGSVSLSSTSPQVDTAVTASLTDPDGGVSATTWQWQASNTSPAVWHNRGTGSSYTPTSSDEGYVLRATASYTDGHGSGKSAQSGATGAVTTPPCALSMSGATSVNYAENGSGSVGTYTATASYCGSLTWSLEGTDAGDFQLTGTGSSRSLQFQSAPNFESPADANTDNDYSVTVKATAASPGLPSATRSVTVTVTNVDEAGSVSLSSTSPQVDTAVTASLSDPDGSVSATTWQWQASNTSPAVWHNRGTGSSYTPTSSDEGYVLRATASYTDGHGSGKSAQSGATDEVQGPSGPGGKPVALADIPDSVVAVVSAPNPFNPSTILHFQLPDAGPVSLIIYNMAGQVVATLVHAHYLEAGVHARVWYGRDDHGRTAASGLYLYRLATGGQVLVGKLALIR